MVHISLKELFQYRQYNESSPAYCFDRKTYTICDIAIVNTQEESPYSRYIPLFQIDQCQLEKDYILQFLGKKELRRFEITTDCFEAFMQKLGLWQSFWNYYVAAVCDIAKQWCIENNLVFCEN